jgi:hypothetical protein
MASWELYAFEPIRREVLERRETSGFQWKWAAGRKAEEGSLNPVVKLNAHLFQRMRRNKRCCAMELPPLC